MNPLARAQKPILILGGAPSLHDDVKKAPSDCIRVSCNHHAAKHYQCDYAAYLDRHTIHTHLIKLSIPSISIHKEADFFVQAPFPYPRNTGIYAAYIASQSKQPVYLAGISLYSEQGYINGEPMGAKNKTLEFRDKLIGIYMRLMTGRGVIVLNETLRKELNKRGFRP